MVVVVTTFPKHPCTTKMETQFCSTIVATKKTLTLICKSSHFSGCRMSCETKIQTFPIGFVCPFAICLKRPIIHRLGSSGFYCAQCEGFEGRMGTVCDTLSCGHVSMFKLDHPLTRPSAWPLMCSLACPLASDSWKTKHFDKPSKTLLPQVSCNARGIGFGPFCGHKYEIRK